MARDGGQELRDGQLVPRGLRVGVQGVVARQVLEQNGGIRLLRRWVAAEGTPGRADRSARAMLSSRRRGLGRRRSRRCLERLRLRGFGQDLDHGLLVEVLRRRDLVEGVQGQRLDGKQLSVLLLRRSSRHCLLRLDLRARIRAGVRGSLRRGCLWCLGWWMTKGVGPWM